MRIGVNCGHTASGNGYGAVGIIKESEHTRLVGYELMRMFRNAGVEVVDCTIDQANTNTEYLAAAVALANRQDLDWFISIHFNASGSHTGNGVEAYTYEGRQYEDAVEVCKNIAELGFKNRGVKTGTGLYVIRKTKAKSLLVEVCFCDNEKDVNTYLHLGEKKIAQAIFNAMYNYTIAETAKPTEMSETEFIEFVGNVARKDWQDRKIMIPSLVVAQAYLESDKGRSELAKNANALFGIKKNGWTGKTYFKDATEQNPDGTYRKDLSTEWRAYDSWEQSIIDHNTYIAERKVGGQTTPNYAELVGQTNLRKAIAGLVGNGIRQQCADYCTDAELKNAILDGSTQYSYATAHHYAQTMLDLITKLNLTRFDDEAEEKEEVAPEGYLYIVQTGAFSKKKNAEAMSEKLNAQGIENLIKLYKQN